MAIVSYGGPVGEHQRSAADEIHEVLQSLRSLDLHDETAQFHDEVARLAVRDPELAASEATSVLRAAEIAVRVAAVYLLGRCSEVGDSALVDRVESTLVAHADTEVARPVMEALAIALGHAWARQSDETFSKQQECAVSQNVTLRLAAAQALALSTEVPLPSRLVPIAEVLATDPDPGVRSWAEDALSYRDGWPAD